ncbi:MAG: hypothetical protein PSV35_07330, partial [bacterium]|nr:hypothetical protein [bacterium]
RVEAVGSYRILSTKASRRDYVSPQLNGFQVEVFELTAANLKCITLDKGFFIPIPPQSVRAKEAVKPSLSPCTKASRRGYVSPQLEWVSGGGF